VHSEFRFEHVHFQATILKYSKFKVTISCRDNKHSISLNVEKVEVVTTQVG